MAWTTLGTLCWQIYTHLNLTFLKEPGIGDWLRTYLGVYLWLNLPLAIFLSCGWLMRRKLDGPAIRTADSSARTPRKWPLDMPAWFGVQVILGAGAAGAINVLLMMGVDLGRSSDWHWLLVPWGAVGMAVFAVSATRAVLYPEVGDGTGAQAPRAYEANAYLWDWFGDAVVAAIFSGLLSLVMIATFAGKLTHDDFSDFAVIAGILLLPLCCMFVRHVVASVLRWRRSMAGR
ncbi:MAG: hypothetical protein ACKVP5_17280 [Aestuariivirga sp.]